MNTALPWLVVGGVLGYLLARSIPYTSLKQINKKLGRIELKLMSTEARLKAVADSIESFKTEAQASLDNLLGDITRLTEAVSAGQPSEETVSRLETLSEGLNTFKSALASLAALTPEPGTEEPPVEEPPVEDPGGEIGQ